MNNRSTLPYIYTLLMCAQLMTAVAHAIADPYEDTNRDIETFNTAVDHVLLKPTTEAYVAVTPNPMRTAFTNVVNNLSEPITIANDLLQGKITQSVQDSARFIFNSTFGLLGLIDIATPMGLIRHDEDLGQTFAVWGWDDSDYLNLPLLGPATVRDASAKPISMLAMSSYGLPFWIIKTLSTREKLLPLDPMLDTASDRYAFIRDGYLQQRTYQINDGKVSNANKFKDFDFSD